MNSSAVSQKIFIIAIRKSNVSAIARRVNYTSNALEFIMLRKFVTALLILRATVLGSGNMGSRIVRNELCISSLDVFE